MGATLTIIGHPQRVRTADERQVAFEIVAGPPNSTFAPKGMPVFGLVTYHILCQQRMWDRGHLDREDRSDVIVEGYLEPRFGEDGGLFIAVVATSLTTRLVQITRKAQQLLAEAVEADRVYRALCTQYSADSPVVKDAEAAMEKAREGLAHYCKLNQGVLRPELIGAPVEEIEGAALALAA